MSSELREKELESLTMFRLRRFVDDLGFDLDDAELLAAHDVDWHEAARLLDRGCPHRLAVRLLL